MTDCADQSCLFPCSHAPSQLDSSRRPSDSRSRSSRPSRPNSSRWTPRPPRSRPRRPRSQQRSRSQSCPAADIGLTITDCAWILGSGSRTARTSSRLPRCGTGRGPCRRGSRTTRGSSTSCPGRTSTVRRPPFPLPETTADDMGCRRRVLHRSGGRVRDDQRAPARAAAQHARRLARDQRGVGPHPPPPAHDRAQVCLHVRDVSPPPLSPPCGTR